MSVVWRGHDVILDRDVAVKVLATRGDDRTVLGAILTEAKATARLSHPHVANVFDYGEAPDGVASRTPYVVMELLVGDSLADAIATHPVEPATMLTACAQVADALAAAHAQGLVHRDVKPSNVILTASGAKVFDFGIAAAIGADDGARPDRPVLGTVGYLAPERLAGAPVSTAVDVYALGMMLYRVLTHERPWDATTPAELMSAHLFLDPADLPPVDGVPAEVGDLYRRCVAKDPADRPSAREAATVLARAVNAVSDAAGAVSDLDAWAEPSSPTHPPPRRALTRFEPTVAMMLASPLPAWEPHPGRRPIVVGTVIAVMFVLAVATFALGLRSGSEAGTAKGSFGAAHPTTAPVPEPTREVADTSKSFSSSGGTVVATCTGSSARLRSWQPASGFRARDIDAGPGIRASLVFKLHGTEITMTASCANGVPTVATSIKR